MGRIENGEKEALSASHGQTFHPEASQGLLEAVDVGA